MEFIIQRINLDQDRLIITTHSPYLLTALDNLIQAKSIADQKPSLRDGLMHWCRPLRGSLLSGLSSYYFSEGGCQATLDPEMPSIGPSNIDDVSVE